MRYDANIPLRVSIEQKSKLVDYAIKMKKEPAQIIREFIDSIDSDENKILETIGFHNYEITRLSHILENKANINSLKTEEKKEVLIKRDIKNDIKKLVSSYLKQLMNTFGSQLEFNTEQEKIEKIKMVIEAVGHLKIEHEQSEEIRLHVKEKVCIHILNLNRDELDKIIKCNTL